MENPAVALPLTAQVSPEGNRSGVPPRGPAPSRSTAGRRQPGCDVLVLAALLSPGEIARLCVN